MNSNVTVITIARKMTPEVKTLVDSILVQLPGAEVILVLDSDAISGLTHPQVKIINTKQRLGPGNARNTGALIASGDQLIFIDGDLVLEKTALKNLLDCLASKDFVISNIQYMKTEHETPVMTYSRLKGLETEEFGNPYRYGQSAIFGISKRAFQRLEGFNTALRSAEDNDFGYRAVKEKLMLGYCGSSIAYHPAKSGREIYRAHLRNKAGRNKVAELHAPGLPAWKVKFTDLLKNTIRLFLIYRLYRRSSYRHHPELSGWRLIRALLQLQWNDLKAGFRILFFKEDSNIHYE